MALLSGAAPVAGSPARVRSVALFRGVWTVQADIVSPGAGSGLYLPDPTGVAYPKRRTGQWALDNRPFDICHVVTKVGSDPIASTGQKNCTLSMSGAMHPVAGIGSACGWGFDTGEGTLRQGFVSPDVFAQTYSLAEIAAYRGDGHIVLEVTYHRVVGTKPNEDNEVAVGLGIGLLQIQGGAACAPPGGPGANQFDVTGVLVLL